MSLGSFVVLDRVNRAEARLTVPRVATPSGLWDAFEIALLLPTSRGVEMEVVVDRPGLTRELLAVVALTL